jgi:hypothetical protein
VRACAGVTLRARCPSPPPNFLRRSSMVRGHNCRPTPPSPFALAVLLKSSCPPWFRPVRVSPSPRDVDVVRRLTVVLCTWDASLVPRLMEAGVLRQALSCVLPLPACSTPARVSQFCAVAAAPDGTGAAAVGRGGTVPPTGRPPGAEGAGAGAGESAEAGVDTAAAAAERALGDHRFRVALGALDTVHACMARCWDAAAFAARVPGFAAVAAGDALASVQPEYGVLWPLVLAAALTSSTPVPVPAKRGDGPMAAAAGPAVMLVRCHPFRPWRLLVLLLVWFTVFGVFACVCVLLCVGVLCGVFGVCGVCGGCMCV